MYFFSVVSFLIIIYLIFLFILYNFQRSLLYHPTENNYQGDKLTVEIEKVKILTEDNIELSAWYHKKNLETIKQFYIFMEMQVH